MEPDQVGRDEMDAGAEVLDPVAAPLYALYEMIWRTGLRSFLQEMQSEPRNPDAQIFDSSRFARCKVEGRTIIAADGRRIPLDECRLSCRWDPVPGSPDGDFAAIAVIARDRLRYGYLVDLWMRRSRPSAQLEALWSLHDRWGFGRASLESNGFQRLLGDDFRRTREARKTAGKPWQLTVEEEPASANKEERIASLEVPLSNGWLQVADSIQQDALLQFDDFPAGDHDDAPDAVEGAWARSGGGPPGMGGERLR